MKHSIVGAILATSLLVAPIANAQTTTQINDPYTDTLELWSEIAQAFSAMTRDVATLFGPHQPASSNAQKSEPAAAATAFYSTPIATSTIDNVPATSTATTTNTTTSDQTTLSQNVRSAAFVSPNASSASKTSKDAIFSAATSASDASFVTQDQFDAAMSALGASVQQLLDKSNTYTLPPYVAADGNPNVPYAAENNIGNLSGVTITNANLTASEIPALNYFPATSTVSVGYGGTGTSNPPTYGQLLVGNGSGGYSLMATSSLGISGGGGSGTVNSGTQGQFAFYNTAGTALTATSSLFVSQSGNIGIGTTSPNSALDLENGSIFLNPGKTAAERYTLSGRTGLGLPVPFVTPTTANTPIAFDVGPTSGATDYSGIGVSWIDICDALATCTTSPNSNYESLRLGIHANGTAFVGSAAGGTGAIHNLQIQPSGGLVVVGTSSTPTGELQVAGNEAQSSFASTGNTQLVLTDDNSGNERLLVGFITDSGYGVIQTLQNGVSWSTYNLALQPKGGYVGIGTTTPYSRLTVWGPDTASTSAFAVVNSASTTVFSVFDNGNSTYSGSIFQSSDQRLKTDVQSLDASSSLASIEQLNPVSYLRIDQPGTNENLGFIAQAVQQIFPELVSTTSATALTPDGTLTLNYEGLIAPIVAAVQALDSELTQIETTISSFAQSITSAVGNFGTVNATTVCLAESGGSHVCVTGEQLAALLSQTGSAAAPESVSQSAPQNSSATSSESVSSPPGSAGSGAATDAPPQIEINGDNPAIVQVGDVYNDLGATITGPQADLNLGIETLVNGVLMSPVQIDTSEAATDTVDYVVTDQNGLTSTTTRTVIIEPAQAPFIAPSENAASTSAPTAQQ